MKPMPRPVICHLRGSLNTVLQHFPTVGLRKGLLWLGQGFEDSGVVVDMLEECRVSCWNERVFGEHSQFFLELSESFRMLDSGSLIESESFIASSRARSIFGLEVSSD